MDVGEDVLAAAAVADGSTNRVVQALESQLEFVNVSGDVFKETQPNIAVQVYYVYTTFLVHN